VLTVLLLSAPPLALTAFISQPLYLSDPEQEAMVVTNFDSWMIMGLQHVPGTHQTHVYRVEAQLCQDTSRKSKHQGCFVTCHHIQQIQFRTILSPLGHDLRHSKQHLLPTCTPRAWCSQASAFQHSAGILVPGVWRLGMVSQAFA